jgi:hypothetical protein
MSNKMREYVRNKAKLWGANMRKENVDYKIKRALSPVGNVI